MVELSVVVPCYNEEESVAELYRRVSDVCKNSSVKSYEIILINDGSKDKTLSIMKEMSEAADDLVIVDLSRNHGHQLALTAGLSQAKGDYILVLDADLQDPPELLEPMLARAKAGIDVVYGQRTVRPGETWQKLFMTKWFYRLLSYLSDIPIPENVGDFRLMNRRVLDELMAMSEHHRFIRGMISWIGFKQEAFPYERHARYAGVTKYPFWKLIQFAFDAISSFSIKPLRLSIPFAMFGAFLAFLLGCYAIIAYMLGGTAVGWASIATIITFFSALQLICIGLIGEYLGRTYIQVKGRPLFIINQVYRKEKATPKKRVKKADPEKADKKEQA